MNGRRKLIILGMAGFLCLAPLPAGSQATDRQQVALEYMRNGQWDFANHEWRQLIAEEPRNVQAHIGLARSLAQGGFLQEAVWHLENVRRELNAPDLEIELAHACLGMGWSEKALGHLLGVIKQKPYHPGAFKGLMEVSPSLPPGQRKLLAEHLKSRAQKAGELARKKLTAGEYRQALPYFEIALAYKARDDLKNDYGLALLLSGQGEQAARVLNTLEKPDAMWHAHANAALAHLSMDQTVAARTAAEKAIALAGNAKDKAKLYNLLGYIYERAHKTSSARFAYERALELDPDLTKARLNLAYIFQQSYQFQPAVALYEEMLHREPGNAFVWNRLGFAYELMREDKKARTAYEKAIAADPGFKEAYTNLATLYQKMDEGKKSDAMLKKAMELNFSGIENRRRQPAKAPRHPDNHPLFRFVDVFMADNPS